MIDPIFDLPYERRPKERYYQFSALYEPYPEEYMNGDIERICVRDQGRRGTCVGQSAAYAMDLNYVKLTKDVGSTECKRGGDIDELGENAFSAECAYIWSREEGKITFPSGSFIWAVMQALKNRGVCLDEQWRSPKNEGAGTGQVASIETIVGTASDHKIDGYVALNGVEEVKAAIAKYGFCIGGIDVWSNWKDEIEKTGKFADPKGSVIGGHALVWVGYDKENLYCLHSWNGVPFVGSISWMYFAKCASEFFAIIDEKEVQIVKRKYARIEIESDVPAEIIVNGTSHGTSPVVLQLEHKKIYNVIASLGITTRGKSVIVDGDSIVRFRFLPEVDYFDFINRLRARLRWRQRYSNISRLDACLGITDDLEVFINEFCNDPDEWHALWYGWFAAGEEGATKFDKDRIPDYLPEDVKAAIHKEYHYYNLGWYARKFWDVEIANLPIGKGTTVAAVIAVVAKVFEIW